MGSRLPPTSETASSPIGSRDGSRQSTVLSNLASSIKHMPRRLASHNGVLGRFKLLLAAKPIPHDVLPSTLQQHSRRRQKSGAVDPPRPTCSLLAGFCGLPTFDPSSWSHSTRPPIVRSASKGGGGRGEGGRHSWFTRIVISSGTA